MGGLRALGLALIVSPALALAQPASDVQRQQAGDLVKKAIAKSQAGEHELAIELYEQAYAIAPTPLLFSNIGAEYQAMAKPVEALSYFCKYLASDLSGSNAAYATAQVKTLQLQQGLPVGDDNDVCKPAPPHAVGDASAASLVVTPPSSLASSLASSSGESARPGRAMEYAGAAIAAIGTAGAVVAIIYAVKAKRLSDFQSNHNTTDPWPPTFDGVPIADWATTGHTWNRDTYVYGIGGGIVLLAGVALCYRGYRGHVSITPVATRSSGGLSVTASF